MPSIEPGIAVLATGHTLLKVPISASSYADRDIDETDGEIRKQLGAQCGGGAVADVRIERSLRFPPTGEDHLVKGRRYSVRGEATCLMLVAPVGAASARLRNDTTSRPVF